MKLFQAKFIFVLLLVCTFDIDHTQGWGDKAADSPKSTSKLMKEIQAFKEEKEFEISEIKNKLNGIGLLQVIRLNTLCHIAVNA